MQHGAKRQRVEGETEVEERAEFKRLPTVLSAKTLSYLGPLEVVTLNGVCKSWRPLVEQALRLVTTLDLDDKWLKALATPLSRGRVLGLFQFVLNPRRIAQLRVSNSKALEDVTFVEALCEILVAVEKATITVDIAKTEEGLFCLSAKLKNLTDLCAVPTGRGKLMLSSRPLTKLFVLQPLRFLGGWLYPNHLRELICSSWDIKDKANLEALARCTNLDVFHVVCDTDHDPGSFMDAVAGPLGDYVPGLSTLLVSQRPKQPIIPFQFRWLSGLLKMTKLKIFVFARMGSAEDDNEHIALTESDVGLLDAALGAWPLLEQFRITAPMAVPRTFFDQIKGGSGTLRIGVKPLDDQTDYPLQSVTRWLMRFPESYLHSQLMNLRCEASDEPIDWSRCAGRIWAACQERFCIGDQKMSQALFDNLLRDTGVTRIRLSGDDNAVASTLRTIAPHLHSAVAIDLRFPGGVTGAMVQALTDLPKLVVLSMDPARLDMQGWKEFVTKKKTRWLGRVCMHALGLDISPCATLRDEDKVLSVDSLDDLWVVMRYTKTGNVTKTIENKTYGLSKWEVQGKQPTYEYWTCST